MKQAASTKLMTTEPPCLLALCLLAPAAVRACESFGMRWGRGSQLRRCREVERTHTTAGSFHPSQCKFRHSQLPAQKCARGRSMGVEDGIDVHRAPCRVVSSDDVWARGGGFLGQVEPTRAQSRRRGVSKPVDRPCTQRLQSFAITVGPKPCILPAFFDTSWKAGGRTGHRRSFEGQRQRARTLYDQPLICHISGQERP